MSPCIVNFTFCLESVLVWAHIDRTYCSYRNLFISHHPPVLCFSTFPPTCSLHPAHNTHTLLSHHTQWRRASGWWRGGHDQGCFRLDRKLSGCEVCLWVSVCVKQEACGLWGLRHVCVRSQWRSGPDGRHPRWAYVWVQPGQGSNWAWSQRSAGYPSARKKTTDLLLLFSLSPTVPLLFLLPSVYFS